MFVSCHDNFSFSVATGRRAYCEPKVDNASAYKSVEVGFASAEDSLLKGKGDVFGYVPVSTIVDLIDKHGGAVNSQSLPDWLKNALAAAEVENAANP